MARSSSAAKARPVAEDSSSRNSGEKASASHTTSQSHPSDSQHNAQQQQASVQPSPPPVEPEDAYLTGTSRSLQRRVLGLNVDGHHAQQHPETPAGQHATGSFTDKETTKK